MQKRGFLLSGLAVAACASSGFAAISASMAANSTTGIAGITSWPLPYNDTSVANPSLFGVTENNYGGSSLFSMAESWTATASGNLEHVQITITGTAPVNFDVAVYQANANVWAEITTGTYTVTASPAQIAVDALGQITVAYAQTAGFDPSSCPTTSGSEVGGTVRLDQVSGPVTGHLSVTFRDGGTLAS